MTEQQQYACSLTPKGFARRTPQLRALAAQQRQHEWQGADRVVLTFPADAQHLVEEFVADESSCCGFFGFDVSHTEDTLQLSVSAPDGAEDLLEALVAQLSH